MMIPDTPLPWTKRNTIDLLTSDPLPTIFHWPHVEGSERPVCPTHSALRGGYGKWLAEGPQFPGLFELIDDLLADADTAGTGHCFISQPVAGTAWSQWLTIKLKALREKFGGHAPRASAQSLAHYLRAVRTRPNDAAHLF